ncbi:uncharacterized protein [Miscanthus floridulus]|uniref:uncharacterized protein n=1 Tax=Miscanthus floridulus TaxID=154761 RepID=UPI003457B046
MTTYIKSINRKVWKVVETNIEVDNLENSTAGEEVLLQNNDIALSAIHDVVDERTFEHIKNIEMAHEAWKKLDESFEGTQAVKGAKAYIFKEKFASFKMKNDESVLEIYDDEKKEKNKENKDDKKDEKKSVEFKAASSLGKAKQKTSSEDECSSFDEDDDEKMALFVKKFGKFMMKKSYRARRKKSSSKNNDDQRRKSSKKKALTSIAINEKPSLFDTLLTCFMAKVTKVKSDDERSGSDSESDDKDEPSNKDEPSKDELFDMLEHARTHLDIKRRECKDLRKELRALKQTFNELNASHERLEEAHEKLGKAHKNLEKAHSTLLEQNEKEHVVSCDVGLACDIIDNLSTSILLLLPLTLLVALPLLPHLVVMVHL